MIILNASYTTTVQYLSGVTVVASQVTDTLYVREVRLDFQTGAMYATIERGTTLPSGEFTSNYAPVEIVVNPDGSFVSNDSHWTGTLASAPAFVAQLKAQFDQFVLASGAVTGTAK